MNEKPFDNRAWLLVIPVVILSLPLARLFR